jgi:hypothetical protein
MFRAANASYINERVYNLCISLKKTRSQVTWHSNARIFYFFWALKLKLNPLENLSNWR